MMNIVENEAKGFASRFISEIKKGSLEKIGYTLGHKLIYFKRDRDKLDFLKVLRIGVEEHLENHIQTCERENCSYDEMVGVGLFVIDQEIDSINMYFRNEPADENKFTPEEESLLHSKINDILFEITKLSLGQEIIFEELESLKNHFNLGRKEWFQLLKGKLFDLVADAVLEQKEVSEIFNRLREGFSESAKLIN